MEIRRFRFAHWLELSAAIAVVLVALAGAYQIFFVPPAPEATKGTFSLLQQRVDVLAKEKSPINREGYCIPLSSFGRSMDAQLPANARVFLLGMLGKENNGNLGFYYILNYYLFPREVGISIGEPAKFVYGDVKGRSPASPEELAKAGYDLALQRMPDGRWQSKAFKQLEPRVDETTLKIPSSDGIVAFFLPLVVALVGTRLIRWLFRDLRGVLSFGELLACGLAVGAFLSTQLILGLRMAGVRIEQALAMGFALWALVEIVLFFKRWRPEQPRFDIHWLWWVLLVPVGLVLWCMFSLAGLEGLIDFDSVAFWAFKAKLFYLVSGKDLWPWIRDSRLAFAHMDYPLLVPMLHTFTYGALGHINEFVTKFWNQWMLLLLALAILSAGQFPRRRAWLLAAAASAVILLPITLEWTRTEGGATPMFFYTVLGSLQLAIGIAEKQSGRIRLGLLLLMALAMVKFEGVMLLGIWGVLLLLQKEGRAAFWPPHRVWPAALLGILAWAPYVIFRMHGPVLHPDNEGLKQLVSHPADVVSKLPMTFVAFIARRLFNNDFAAWETTDNQHAVWSGKWLGWKSFFDDATVGMGWVCLLLLAVAWLRGGQIRWTAVWLCVVFVGFTAAVSVVWSGAYDYKGALAISYRGGGGRYLYPVMAGWFAATVVILTRVLPEKEKPLQQPEHDKKSKSRRG